MLNDSSQALVLMFKTLGDPTRLRIFDYLRACSSTVTVDECGDVRPVDGPTVGDVCCHITGAEKVSSTISFHLKELRHAGLITMERRGKNLMCSINRAALESLMDYLSERGDTAEKCCEETVSSERAF